MRPLSEQIEPGRSRLRRWGVRSLIALGICIALGLGSVSALWIATPSVNDAPAKVAAKLAAHHGESINGALPEKVSKALVATEDSRFYADHGLDVIGVVRETFGYTQGKDLGGATLDQQLAKELWTPDQSGLDRELTDIGLAIKLDAHFTKTQILAMYLDEAYYGDGAYGVQTAALHYFGLPASQLSWGQASMLAGLVQAPSSYDPHGHLALARSRQSHVLDRLVAVHALTRAQADAAYASDLHPKVTFYG